MPFLRIASRWSTCAFVLASLLWVVIAAPAKASTIYRYTGNNFDSFSGGSAYSTSDSVSAELTLSSPLPVNASGFVDLGPLQSWSFSDGVQTISSSDVDAALNLMIITGTDSASLPLQWLFDVRVGDPVVGGTITRNDSVQVFDFGSTTISQVPSSGNVSNNPGQWTIVPEPSTLGLLALGLFGVGAFRRRQQAAT